MSKLKKRFTVLIADDDADDCVLMREAFKENQFSGDLHFVNDGVEALQFLRSEGEYENQAVGELPTLFLLDLNMPKKDGREVLFEIKKDSRLNRIPIIVLTTSKMPEDITICEELGAASYITKPASYKELVRIVKDLEPYWQGDGMDRT
ncbi:MAG: response regulator [Deltaproteobacteria bacterium]|nr:response regulator [Deltaproteobacteria bacterium]